jgi:hypothetical protein
LCIITASPLVADVEERASESKTFSGAKLLIVDNVWGSIEVAGYGGNDVQVEVAKRIRGETQERADAAKREIRLDMTQSGDTVKLYVDGPFRCHCADSDRSVSMRGHSGYEVNYDFRIRVPREARVDLYTVNGGRIDVQDVAGDFDVGNVNGAIEMRGMSGSGRAHTVNGKVTAMFSANPKSGAAFETINGDLDLTFQKGLSADVRMSTMHGGMYTDYDVAALPPEAAAPERRGGKFVYHRSSMAGVRIGSGGVDLKLKTLNGDIFIRSH